MSKKGKLINLICCFALIIVVVLIVILSFALVTSLQKPKLVFVSGSSAITYNGEVLTNDSWNLLEGELKDGHYANVEVLGKQEGVGMSDNVIKATIVDKEGNDVTKEYKIKYEFGTLSVKKIQLIITAGSVGKVYDGKELTYDTFYIKNYEYIVEGHTVKPTIEGSITDRGVTDNVISSVKVLDANGEDITKVYSIITVSGKLYVADKKSSIPSIPKVEGIKAIGEYQK